MTASEHTELLPDLIRDLCGDEVNGGFIRDLCFTVWSKCHNPTHEDGNTDWGNDTLPTVQEGVKRIREKLVAFSESATDGAEPVPVAWRDGASLFTYTRTFNAIAAATEINAVGIGISVRKFVEAFGPIASPTGMGVTEEQRLEAGKAADFLCGASTLHPGGEWEQRMLSASELLRSLAALHPTSETTTSNLQNLQNASERGR